MEEIAPGYVAVGRVLRAFGVRGELIIEPLAPLRSLSAGERITIFSTEYEIVRERTNGRTVRMKLAGVDTREMARELCGAYLQARADELPPLPEGEYYRFQLIGLTVHSLDGRKLGQITDVLSAPENEIYVVSGPEGEALIPAVDDVVREIDLAGGVVTIEIIPGLLP